MTFYVFWSCRTRFLEHWQNVTHRTRSFSKSDAAAATTRRRRYCHQSSVAAAAAAAAAALLRMQAINLLIESREAELVD